MHLNFIQDLLIRISSKVEKIEGMLQKLIKKEKLSEEESVVKEKMCDSIDLMRIPASNPYA